MQAQALKRQTRDAVRVTAAWDSLSGFAKRRIDLTRVPRVDVNVQLRSTLIALHL
jgi:hypothetical protein